MMHEKLGGGGRSVGIASRSDMRSAALPSHRTYVRTNQRVVVASLMGPSLASSYVFKKEANYEIKGIIGT